MSITALIMLVSAVVLLAVGLLLSTGTDSSQVPSDTTIPRRATTPPTPTPVPPLPARRLPITDMTVICRQLAKTFNSINNVLPMITNFDEGEVAGINYSKGQIILASNASKVDGCTAYALGNIPTMMAHLEIIDNLRIYFPEYMINGIPSVLTLRIERCHVVLHYHITQKTSEGKSRILVLNALMGEVTSLEKVTLELVDLDERDYTRQAEDIVRPKLSEAFDRLVRRELHWEINLDDRDTALDGLESFKLIFKRAMISLASPIQTNSSP